MKKLSSLHNIVENYWCDNNFVFQVYLNSLDKNDVLNKFLENHLKKDFLKNKKYYNRSV